MPCKKCVKSCSLDPVTQKCTGCGRTMEEVRDSYNKHKEPTKELK
jgi:predicted Fe-S protein YdhL (DUF1289 family)|tara:strand:+ start:434 stop:568 length:135 start_codon:yes stop_codon:yes gene_type:complete